MKTRLNKKVLAQFHPLVRSIVVDWKDKWKKAYISLRQVDEVFFHEDAKVYCVNTVSGRSVAARVAGEFAGHSGLRPYDKIKLPIGITIIETGFFLGNPWCTVNEGTHASNSYTALLNALGYPNNEL